MLMTGGSTCSITHSATLLHRFLYHKLLFWVISLGGWRSREAGQVFRSSVIQHSPAAGEVKEHILSLQVTQSLAGYNRSSLDPSGSNIPFASQITSLSSLHRQSNVESQRLALVKKFFFGRQTKHCPPRSCSLLSFTNPPGAGSGEWAFTIIRLQGSTLMFPTVALEQQSFPVGHNRMFLPVLFALHNRWIRVKIQHILQVVRPILRYDQGGILHISQCYSKRLGLVSLQGYMCPYRSRQNMLVTVTLAKATQSQHCFHIAAVTKNILQLTFDVFKKVQSVGCC